MPHYIPPTVFYHFFDAKKAKRMTVLSRRISSTPIEKEVKNEPIHNAIVADVNSKRRKEVIGVSIEVDGKRYITPIPDEELFDIIKNQGVEKGGLIKAPLIWVGSGTYPKLTRIGSETHKIYARKQDLSSQRPVKRNLLQVGTIYENQAKTRGVYLGQANTIELVERPKYSSVMYCRKRRKHMVWLECSSQVTDPQKLFATYLKEPRRLFSYERECTLKVKGSHTFKINREEVIDVPCNIIDILREAYFRELQKNVDARMLWAWDVCEHSRFFNMVPVTEEPIMALKIIEALKYYEHKRFILMDFIPLEELPELLTDKEKWVREAAIKRVVQLGTAKEDLDGRS